MKVHYETMLNLGNGVAYRVGKFDTRKEAVAAMKREKGSAAYVVKVTREVTNRQEGKPDPNRPIVDTLNRVLP